MVPYSPDSFGKRRQWKSGCHVNSMQQQLCYKMWQEDFTYYFLKIFITNCDKQRKIHKFQNNNYKVWQKIMTKCCRCYKVRQNLLQVWEVLQKSVTKSYNKVWQVLQSVIIMTKWDKTSCNRVLD